LGKDFYNRFNKLNIRVSLKSQTPNIMGSNAIGQDYISRVVGYVIKKGNFQRSSPNLPQRIIIFGEANSANQVDLDTDPFEFTSAKQVGEAYGYGSNLHMMARILRPFSGEGVGGIPTIIVAQEEAVGAAAKVIEVTVSGVATGNGTHYLLIAGRDSVDGEVYAINILEGDTAADIHAKIEDTVNGVLGSPMSATSTDYESTLTSKVKGLTTQALSVTVDIGEDDLGVEYVIAQTQAGSGTPDIADAITNFGNAWSTIVINSYGTQSTVMDALEALNGIPLDENPTGRYQGTNWKPFIALTGSVADDPSSVTDTRKEDVTIAICHAPGSAGMQFEAAANVCRLFAVTAQNTPHLDIGGQFYPDMPVPTVIGTMADFTARNVILKKGCSTVDLVSDKYQMQDFVTTYHPVGEVAPQYRYCRDLMLDFNVRYGYMLLEQINVVDHAIANDEDTVTASKVVKPKQWKAILAEYADDLERRALIVDSAFMVESIEVNVSETNPNRLETFFRYKRSGVVRQSATTAEAGFNYGTINA
jgi:phage tail sheath gpL-like